MVRKISMKRKHKNRRTKSKLAFRKTKKLVRKNQTRRRRRQVGGGGCASKGMGVLPGGLAPYRQLPCDVPQPLTSEYIDSLLVNQHDSKPIPEEDAIRRFEKLFEETEINENSTFDMNGETKSILFYLVDSARNTDIDYRYQKLFRWLIEKGANVNYELISPYICSTTTPYASLMYTIVGNVMLLMLDIMESMYDNDDKMFDIYDENKLYKIYNCIYTLVLLLSKGANVLVKIGNHTPLDGLTDKAIDMLQTTIDVRSMNLKDNMESLFPSPPPPSSSSRVPPPPPDITRTKEYVVPRLLLLFEPIASLLALAIYNQTPDKDEVSLNRMFDEVKRAAVTAVTAINDLNCASLELTREPPPVDVDDVKVVFDEEEP